VTLDFDGVSKRFGTTVALDELRFSVPTGRIFGFLGANGAGKTTAMRICLGILGADDGAVLWDGTRTTDLPGRPFGYLPEERGLYPRMTVVDQLVYFASLYGEPH
jgi:ABC-2 type transport system ATP-binding protein